MCLDTLLMLLEAQKFIDALHASLHGKIWMPLHLDDKYAWPSYPEEERAQMLNGTA